MTTHNDGKEKTELTSWIRGEHVDAARPLYGDSRDGDTYARLRSSRDSKAGRSFNDDHRN
jgi:hypothetical protein